MRALAQHAALYLLLCATLVASETIDAVLSSPALLGAQEASVVQGNDTSFVQAPQTALNGEVLNKTTARSLEGCAGACAANSSCAWFTYCDAQGGCGSPQGPLDFRDCLLLQPGANATRLPEVISQGGDVKATSGFPIRQLSTVVFPAFSRTVGLGVSDADLQCNNSVVAGRCAFSSALYATMVCADWPECTSVTVFTDGVNGSTGPLAFLASTSLGPDNSFRAPSVYTLSKTSPGSSLTSKVLLGSEASAILPADNATFTANSTGNTTWLGCIVAPNAVGAGDVVLAGSSNPQPSVESCCQSCRNFTQGPGCSVFNYCEQQAGCSIRTSNNSVVQLSQGQCELRYQETANATNGWPPVVFSKGPSVSFTMGSPLLVASPPVPGYTEYPGQGLYLYGGLQCNGSLRADIQECVLPGTLADIKAACDANPECNAFVYKPGGFLGSQSGVGALKRSADPSRVTWNPTGVLYVQDSSTGASTGSGLSGGAIAGIVVGSLAGAALLAAVLVLAVRRRRTRHAEASSKDKDGSLQEVIVQTQPPSAGSASAQTSTLQDSASSTVGRLGSSLVPSRRVNVDPDDAGMSSSALVSHSMTPSEIEQLNGLSDDTPFSVDLLPRDLQQWVIQADEFTILCHADGRPQELGAGACGTVFKAEYHGEVVAAKELTLKGPAAQKLFVMEALRLHQLRHPHIIGLVGVSVTEDKAYLIMEYCDGRDLLAALRLRVPASAAVTDTSSQRVPSSKSGERVFGWYRRGRTVAYDIARGLNYLHSKNVCHMDIKSSNVLLTGHGAAKLADVGLALTLTKTYLSDLNALVGTFAWAAPEVLMGGKNCSLAVDIYSFGVVLWEICTGEIPRRGHMRAAQVPEDCPQAVADLITRCTSVDPSQRPSAESLMRELSVLSRLGARTHSGMVKASAGTSLPPPQTPSSGSEPPSAQRLPGAAEVGSGQTATTAATEAGLSSQASQPQ